jgi:spore germination protein
MKRIFIISVICFVNILIGHFATMHLITPPHTAMQVINYTASKDREISFSGWLPWWDVKSGMETLSVQSKYFETISPYWFVLNSEGVLSETDFPQKSTFKDNLMTLNPSIKLVPMVTTRLDRENFNQFVQNEEALNRFANSLVTTLVLNKADGVDLDFENLDHTNKDAFSLLVTKIATALHEKNLVLSITLSGRTQKEGNMHPYDFKIISKNADEVRVMIYDKHGEFSAPGAITPCSWFEEVLTYNMEYIPLEKLVVGLPTYGYSWGYNKSFKSMTHNQVEKYFNSQPHVKIKDADSFETIYVTKNEVAWVSDANALEKKVSVARDKGVYKFIFWSISGMDTRFFEKSSTH